MTALASEVLWTRLLALAVGATVYAFSLILAAFLFSLGVGSSLGAALARRTRDPRVALGWCQMLLCAAIAWAAYRLTEVAAAHPDSRIGRPSGQSASATSCAVCRSSCPARCCGARAFRSRSRPRRAGAGFRPGWSAESTPRTPLALSQAPLGAVFLASRIGSQRALQLS